MSGFFDDEKIPEGNDGKPLAFLPKPFTPQLLAEKVKQVISGSKIPNIAPRTKLDSPI